MMNRFTTGSLWTAIGLMAVFMACQAREGQSQVAATATLGSAPCIADVPSELMAPMVARSIVRVGRPAQAELLGFFEGRGLLSDAQIAQIEALLAPSEAVPGDQTDIGGPSRIDFDDLALTVLDYRWYDRVAHASDALGCEILALRAPDACPGRAAEVNNLVVSYLRNRRGLCAASAAWEPPASALPLVTEVHGLIGSGRYFGDLEHWLEQSPRHAFRLTENLFTLIYLDYLGEAYEHRQIDLAYREFLLRRSDLREAYPGLDAITAQLGRLKDLGLIE